MSIREQAIRRPEVWQGALGLLPVPMYPDLKIDGRYVLLNGSSGNFCLNVSLHEVDIRERASQAWSCNVGHYIALRSDFIEVSRWDRPDKVEKYTISSVAENLTQFHAYLESSSPAVATSITAHYGRAFRRLRSAWPDTDGTVALNAFLYLVACASSNSSELSDDELQRWDLPTSAKASARTIGQNDRESLIAHIAGMGSFNSLTPDLGLVIRHASGTVFEDAHRIAEASPQLWLDGFISEALIGSKDERVGINFTPSSIARTLAEEAIASLDTSKPVLSALDPACGSGELLKELIRILEKKGFTGTLRLNGYDASPAAVTMARFTLAYEKLTARNFNVDYSVRECNALDVEWPSCDVVVMNPPFRRWNDLTSDQQERVAEVLGVVASRANYAQAFLHKAATAVGPGGVLAAVAPRALFETDASRSTRALLAENLEPRLVARLGNQFIFKGSLVDAGLYVGVKRPTAAGPALALWADQNPTSIVAALRALRKRFVTGDPITSADAYSIYPDHEIGRTPKPWSPRSLLALKRWAIAERNPKLVRAASHYDIRQGARTGDDVFVVEKSYVEGLPKGEQRFFRPAVLNSSIQGGQLNDRFYVFYPHTPDLPVLASEEDLLLHVGTYANAYLLPKREKLKRRKHKTPNPKWWEMVWPRNWQFEQRPKLVSKYFGGAGSFAWDMAGRFVVVVGHAWIPKEASELRIDLRDAYAITTAVYLNLPETENLIDYLSIRVSGGQLDLSSKYLSSLLVPNPRKLHESVLQRVAERAARNLCDPEAQELLRSSLQG